MAKKGGWGSWWKKQRDVSTSELAKHFQEETRITFYSDFQMEEFIPSKQLRLCLEINI